MTDFEKVPMPLLDEAALKVAEEESLRRGIKAVRSRRRQRRIFTFAAPVAAAAAMAIALVHFYEAEPSILSEEEAPSERMAFRSREFDNQNVFRSREGPAAIRTADARTGVPLVEPRSPVMLVESRPAGSEAFRVSTRPSEELEFLAESQLLAVLDGRPFGIQRGADGEKRLFFLEQEDEALVWRP